LTHHLLHRPATDADCVEGDGLVPSGLEDLSRLHRPLGRNADGSDRDERLGRATASSTSAMPQAAPAALASTLRMNGFSPMISVTEYIIIIIMWLVPTQGATFPDAIVETMIFGKPYGAPASL
jgi:hypothetical protein